MDKTVYNENLAAKLIDDTDDTYQARLDYDPEEIQALAQDIEQYGQRNPIGVKPKGEQYQIIYGFQRVKAVKQLEHDTIKAVIYTGLTDEEAHIHSVSDNVRPGKLTDLEKSLKCKQLREKGFDIPKLCEIFGVKKSVIYNYLNVAELDRPTKDCLQLELISLNHAVELARIDDFSKRLETLRKVLSYEWSVRNLKTWRKEGRAPLVTRSGSGMVVLCPKHLKMVPVHPMDNDNNQEICCINCEHLVEEINDKIDNINDIKPDELCQGCLEHLDLVLKRIQYIRCDFDLSQYPDGIQRILKLDGIPKKDLEAKSKKLEMLAKEVS